MSKAGLVFPRLGELFPVTILQARRCVGDRRWGSWWELPQAARLDTTRFGLFAFVLDPRRNSERPEDQNPVDHH